MTAYGRKRFPSLGGPSLDRDYSVFCYHVFEIRISGLLKVARILFVEVAELLLELYKAVRYLILSFVIKWRLCLVVLLKTATGVSIPSFPRGF